MEENYPEPIDSPLKDRTCQNGAQYVNQTQLYNLCWANEDPSEIYRVTKDTLNDLTTLPYYKKRVTCNVTEVSREVCYCPAGYVGSLCQFQDYRQCYVNITDPPLYKGCKGQYPDSDEYVYSTPGFDPCFKYDFTKSYSFKYKLDCRDITSKGIVKEEGHQEGVQYSYSEVISIDEPQNFNYNYLYTNDQTNMKLMDDTTL